MEKTLKARITEVETYTKDVALSVDVLSDVVADIPEKIENLSNDITSLRLDFETEVANIETKKGDKGDKGDKGEKGGKGDKGDKGDDGLDGLDGSPDTANDIAKKLNTLTDIIDWKVLKDFKSLVNQDTLTKAVQTLENQTRYLIQSNSSRSTGGGGTGTIGGSISPDQIAIGTGADTITGLSGAPGNILRFDIGAVPVVSDSLIDGAGASSVEFFNRILNDGSVASVNWDTRELFDSAGVLVGTWSATGIELAKSLKVQGITTATIEFLNNTTSPATGSLILPVSIDVVGGQTVFLGEPAGWVIVDTPAGAKKMPYYDL